MVDINSAPINNLLLVEEGAPANPASGKQLLYIDTADHHLKHVDSGGIVTDCDAGGSPSGAAGGDLGGTYPNPSVAQASGAFSLTGVLSPTQITTDQDNYAPTSGAANAVWRLSSDASRNITGISISQAGGRVLVLQNVGTQNIVLKHNVTSTAANRFQLPGSVDLVLRPNQGVILIYDGTDSRWKTSSLGAPSFQSIVGHGTWKVIYTDSSGVEQEVALGSAGQALVSGGVSSAPSFAYPGLVLVEQHTASSSASLDFTTGITSDFDEYRIEIVSLVPATTSVGLLLRMSTNGGSTYDAGTNYGYFEDVVSWAATAGNTGNSGQSAINLIGFGNASNASGRAINASLTLYAPGSSSLHKVVHGHVVYHDGTNYSEADTGGVYVSTTAVNALRILASSGNLASGVIRLYGVAK